MTGHDEYMNDDELDQALLDVDLDQFSSHDQVNDRSTFDSKHQLQGDSKHASDNNKSLGYIQGSRRDEKDDMYAASTFGGIGQSG